MFMSVWRVRFGRSRATARYDSSASIRSSPANFEIADLTVVLVRIEQHVEITVIVALESFWESAEPFALGGRMVDPTGTFYIYTGQYQPEAANTLRQIKTPTYVTVVGKSRSYETDESEYVRKAGVDEERKETRLQGLKDRLAVSDDPEAEVLRQEVERLEQEIEDLTEFSPGSAFSEQVESG
jgi:hypothetical protein